MATEYTIEDFLDYIKKSKSKNTYKSYKRSIALFSEYFGKTPNEILRMRVEDWKSDDLHQKRRFAREIEKFHAWMIKRDYSINSARANTIGILQLFKYYEMPVTTLSAEVKRTTITTKDFVPTPQQYRRMYKVADSLRDKLIVSMGKDLGWRIGDFAKIRKDQLPDIEQEPPVLFELITEKEDVVAKSFLSQETVDLLKEYLPTVENNPNPCLFPSNREGHFDEESINRVLRELAAKANVRIPKGKRLRFHAFRKRFLTECANLHIDVNTAKVLVGKSADKSMLTYLSEVEHREAFVRVHQRLRLVATPMRKTSETATELQKRVDRLERMINIISAIYPDAVKRADEILKNLGVTMTAEQFTKMTFGEKLDMIAKEQERKQREEYARIIAENNNNNH